ncbi:hypothetical protein, variant [Exophiala oligosperma]|uniref:SET domain-containing protein n=1 Tax=Exophiala oligosperma TaxID=215243 RepID=A0A0D2ASY7_9EURO|nr:hypothetical protein, variant [Exophiala oligosperma]KIW42966.1 hypothetical protein, variant [Exophiala oligosperma]
MASNSQLYDNIFERIRAPLAEAVDDALSSLHQSSGTPLLRLEACLDQDHSEATQGAQKEAKRTTLATIELSSFQRRRGTAEGGTDVEQNHSDQETQPQRPLSNENRPVLKSYRLKRRKVVGGLRLARSAPPTRVASPERETSRRLTSNFRHFPKRNAQTTIYKQQMSPFERLIVGIWEQIHGTPELNPSDWVDLLHQVNQPGATTSIWDVDSRHGIPDSRSILGDGNFRRMNVCCRRITQASRQCRSLEVIVQAQWIQCYEEQVQKLMVEDPDLSLSKGRATVQAQACKDFGWSLKELRNKMAIWRGYDSIREAGGWVPLIFAGMGLYRFCKYRLGFCPQNIATLKRLRLRFEVAADTIHPEWRLLLSIIGKPTTRVYHGHPCDWVVSKDSQPIPLADTYSQWTPAFRFEHLEESTIDEQAWGLIDPRTENSHVQWTLPRQFSCKKCGSTQSNDVSTNECLCFPALFGSGLRKPCPVQVFRTENGRNNGLLACCPFERGAAIGEFVGVITQGIRHLDVMQCSGPAVTYQIWQGHKGNYTRFINHSCQPNSQYEPFLWLGVQRHVLVSKGILAGDEITVDYSDDYWNHLDKECLCGETSCRFKTRNERIPGEQGPTR